MPKEELPSGDPRKEDRHELLRWNHSELRREGKDLRTVVLQTPEDFPHRERLLEIAEEILRRVPIFDQADEDSDERKRQEITAYMRRNAER